MKRTYREQIRKRYAGCLAVLSACLMLAASGLTALAARTGTVTTGANVRQEASTDAQLVASLMAGATVDVTDETEAGGSTWYEVSFIYEGEELSGWIRSDLLSVEGEAEEGTDGETTEEGETAVEEEPESTAAYKIQEPTEAYSEADSLTQTTVQADDGQGYTAYQAASSEELYLVWASDADGNADWYWYDPADGTFQRDNGQFSSEGLISALQNELTELKTTTTEKLNQRLYIIAGLGALSVVLLTVVIILAIRNRDVEYEYYDEEDNGGNEEEKAEFEETEDEEAEEEKPVKKFGLFSRRRREEEDEDDFDGFLEAVREKEWQDDEDAADDDEEEAAEEEPEEEEAEEGSYEELPENDRSGLTDEAEQSSPEEAEEDEEDEEEGGYMDLDIEILDLDDLDI